MFALFLKPLTALAYAMGAVGLSLLWYTGQATTAILLVLVVVVLSYASQVMGRNKLPNDPVAAVKFFNLRPFLIGAITASGAALAFIIGIEWAVEGASQTDTGQVKQTKEAFKEIAQTLTAAVGAYITALTVQAADVDAAVGKYVKEQFYRVYSVAERTNSTPPLPPSVPGRLGSLAESGSTLSADPAAAAIEFDRRLRQLPNTKPDGTIEFQPDSLGAYALYETGVFGLTDWSVESRMRRAEKIKENLSARSTTAPAGPKSNDRGMS